MNPKVKCLMKELIQEQIAKVSKEGVWKITKLVLDHNHDFVPPEQRHLLSSMINMSNVKGDLTKSMVNAGMQVTNIWSYLGEEVGGYNNLGVTLKHMQNYVYNEKLKLIVLRIR
jgi:hypothetical protein